MRREERRLAAMTEQEAKRKKCWRSSRSLNTSGLKMRLFCEQNACRGVNALASMFRAAVMRPVVGSEKGAEFKVDSGDLVVAMYVRDDDATWSLFIAPSASAWSSPSNGVNEQALHRLLSVFHCACMYASGRLEPGACTQHG